MDAGEIREVDIIPSKSYAHRAYICAMLALMSSKSLGSDDESIIDVLAGYPKGRMDDMSLDIKATRYAVLEMIRHGAGSALKLDTGESGSTLRFLIPVAGALGISASFMTHGRLSERPLDDLVSALSEHGVIVDKDGREFSVSGKLTPGTFSIRGDISSQYITGILLALPMTGGGRIDLTTPLKSRKYVDITIDVMRGFGVTVEEDESGFRIGESERYDLPEEASQTETPQIEGDWSNAAFWIAAGLMGSGPVRINGLRYPSSQGDMEIVDIAKRFGGNIEISDGSVTAYPSGLTGTEVDVSDIPDLAPPLAALAAAAKGITRLKGTARLRLKESDRMASIVSALTGSGIGAYDSDDEIIISGAGNGEAGGELAPVGGEIDGKGDHRIVMMAAVLSLITGGKVLIKGSRAVDKSYPGFFRELERMGLDTNLELV